MPTTLRVIDSFSCEHRFLSNFYPSPIVADGFQFPTVEHAFQAAKTAAENEKRRIASAKSPARAKSLGRRVALRKDWESVKVGIMKQCVELKFQSHPDLAKLLLATGDARLIEGNSWNDTFGGVCGGRGKNHLGKNPHASPHRSAVCRGRVGSRVVKKEQLRGDLIFLLHDFLTLSECEQYIQLSESQGYDDAPITTSVGFTVRKNVRNNTRVMMDDVELAGRLWLRARDHVPPEWWYRKPVSLNERFRFYRYEPGQRFVAHSDGAFVRDDGERSELSFLIYLNEDFSRWRNGLLRQRKDSRHSSHWNGSRVRTSTAPRRSRR